MYCEYYICVCCACSVYCVGKTGPILSISRFYPISAIYLCKRESFFFKNMGNCFPTTPDFSPMLYLRNFKHYRDFNFLCFWTGFSGVWFANTEEMLTYSKKLGLIISWYIKCLDSMTKQKCFVINHPRWFKTVLQRAAQSLCGAPPKLKLSSGAQLN